MKNNMIFVAATLAVALLSGCSQKVPEMGMLDSGLEGSGKDSAEYAGTVSHG